MPLDPLTIWWSTADIARIDRKQREPNYMQALLYLSRERTYPCRPNWQHLIPRKEPSLATYQSDDREYYVRKQRVRRWWWRWHEVSSRYVARESGNGNNHCKSDRHYKAFHLSVSFEFEDTNVLVSEMPKC
jgi:hypothetical protein